MPAKRAGLFHASRPGSIDPPQGRLHLGTGLRDKFSNEAHWGSTYWLTGANRYAAVNSISADQVAAQLLGQDTRFSSIQLDTSDGSGSGPGLSLAISVVNPSPDSPIRYRYSTNYFQPRSCLSRSGKKRSLKTVACWMPFSLEAKRVQRGLTKTDNDKIDEYFQSIRDIETRLSKDEDWLDVPKAESPMDEPKLGLKRATKSR